MKDLNKNTYQNKDLYGTAKTLIVYYFRSTDLKNFSLFIFEHLMKKNQKHVKI